MSDRPTLYSASPGDTAEVQRALRFCLGGMRPPAVLSCPRGEFPGWYRKHYLPVLAPHLLRVYNMALSGDAKGVAAADLALGLPAASTAAGRNLLSMRTGARPLPVLRKFTAAVADGSAAGHFATVMALYAADFSIALLPLLQGVLYCEWRSSQPEGAPAGLNEFLRLAAGLIPSLASLLIPHGHDFALPAARLL